MTGQSFLRLVAVGMEITAQVGAHSPPPPRQRSSNASANSQHSFVVDLIEPGSTVHTDGWQGCKGLEQKNYNCESIVIGKKRKDAVKLMPHVHPVISLLQRWLLGTHQGAVSQSHMAYYLDQFTFRLNRRTSKSRGKLLYGLVQQAVTTAPAVYDQLMQSRKSTASSKTQALGVT